MTTPMTKSEIMYRLEDNDFTMALEEAVSFTNLQSIRSAQVEDDNGNVLVTEKVGDRGLYTISTEQKPRIDAQVL